MNTIARLSKKAQQNDLVRTGHEQLALISAREQEAKLERQDPVDGGIELVRIMRLSRRERKDVTWPDRDSLSLDDVSAAALLDEDDLQEAMRVRPVNHGVPSANEPARVDAWRAPDIAQVFRRNDAGSRGQTVGPALPWRSGAMLLHHPRKTLDLRAQPVNRISG
jgi:hypothetical protein